MREKDRFFAIIPIHGETRLVEGENVDQINERVDEVLRKVEVSYPFRDFRSEITLIKGRKIKLPKQR